MPSHVFVDENKSRGLLMAAAACVAGDVNAHRRTMRGLLLPRQRRLHFFKESAAHQRKILAVIEGFGLDVKLYATPSDSHTGRERCLNAIVRDATEVAERLVIERDESRLEFDKKALYHAVRTHRCVDTLGYELLAGTSCSRRTWTRFSGSLTRSPGRGPRAVTGGSSSRRIAS